MEAIARQLFGGDIAADVAGLDGFDQQIADKVADLLLGPHDLLVSMQERCEVGVVVAVGTMCDERVRLEHRLQPFAGEGRPIPNFGEVVQMTCDLAVVPRSQNGFCIREVLVQGGPPDAGLLRDPRHRYGAQPVLSDQRGLLSGLLGAAAAAMLLAAAVITVQGHVPLPSVG
jgi:hypothetical protein